MHILAFSMHLHALEVGLKVHFNEMYAVILVLVMHLQALEVGYRVKFKDMSAVINTCIFNASSRIGGWFEGAFV